MTKIFMHSRSEPDTDIHSPLPTRQFKWFVRFFHVVFIGGLCVCLILRWRRPETLFGATDLLLIGLVLAQIALYICLFAIPSHTGRWRNLSWMSFYFVASMAIYFVECRIDSAFHWAVGFYLGQLLALPWRFSLPGTVVLFTGYFLTVFGWKELSRFSAFNWFIALGVVGAWTAFFLFFHRALTTSSERAQLISELEAAKCKLELARQRDAELAVLRERERLARDLHDSLGHSLVTLTVQLEAAQRLLSTDPVRATASLDQMQKLTRSSMEDLRRSLANLRAAGLGERSLPEAVRSLCADAGKRLGVSIECQVSEGVNHLPPVVAEVLWRVAQEGLTNVEKHAQAKHIRISLDLTPKEVLLRVSDDGVGLPLNVETKPGHYGLRGMRERVEGVGGAFVLTAGNPTGTVVEARVPLVG